jgi:hypothetical protein
MMRTWHAICQQNDMTICQHHDSYHWFDDSISSHLLTRWVDASYNDSLMWRSDVFSLGTLCSNACGD